MKRKTLLVIMLALCLCVALVSCGGGNTADDSTVNSTTAASNGESINNDSSTIDSSTADGGETDESTENSYGNSGTTDSSTTDSGMVDSSTTDGSTVDSGETDEGTDNSSTQSSTEGGDTTDSSQKEEKPDEPHVHSYGKWQTTKEPTCTEAGRRTQACSCGDVVTEEIKATGHTEETIEGKEPSCTETGLTEGKKCSVCGETTLVQEIVPAKGHEYGEWEITTEATCTEAGEKSAKCLCGDTISEEIETKSHNYVDGNCSVCGKEMPVSQGLEYTLSSDSTYYIVSGKGTCTDTDVYIPKNYENIPVVCIDKRAFRNWENITSITIPNSVTTIDEEAFRGCTNLTSVTFEDGSQLTSICGYAFYNCTSLTRIEIPSSVTSIGDSAFDNCRSLINVTIPKGVTSIGKSTFYGCESLTRIEIPSSVTSIGDCAFYGCESLTSIEIPNGVTNIGVCAFYGCESLTSIEIPNGVTNIGDCAFRDCTSLTSITIPNGVVSIGGDAFNDCESLNAIYITDIESWYGIEFEDSDSNPLKYAHNLYLNGVLVTELVVPNDLTNIGDYTFYGCGSLTKVTLEVGSKLTSIGDGAFGECNSLVSITIPSGLTNLGGGAFSGCDSLDYNTYDNALYIGNEEKPYIILVKATDKDITSCNINEQTKFIHCAAFYECSNLTNVAIPNGIMSIEFNAFCNCDDLISITIPSSVEYLGDYVLEGCGSLTSVIFESGSRITSIGYHAFFECANLTSVTIPNGVTSIGGAAFYGCGSLTSITIPNGVTSIGGAAFYGCGSLTIYCEAESEPSDWSFGWYGTLTSGFCSIVWDCKNNDVSIYDSIYTVVDGIRYSIKDNVATVVAQPINIKQAVIASSITYKGVSYPVTQIGGYAFNGRDGLTSVSIPSSVTLIDSSAFKDCDGLTSIIIPNGVTSIGRYAFSGCDNLTSVTISDSVTKVEDYAFENCFNLTNITFKEESRLEHIGWQAFSGCDSLASIVIPRSVTTVEAKAFLDCDSLTIYCEIESNPSKWYSDWNASNCPVVWNCQNNAIADDGYIYMVVDGIRYGIKDSMATVAKQPRNIQEATIPSTIVYMGISYPIANIDTLAFHDCHSLTSITVDKDNQAYMSVDGNLYTKDGKALVQYAIGKTYTEFVIPSGVTSIDSYAFSGCDSLTKIMFEDGSRLTSIGSYAFSNCDSLTSIVIPNGVTRIDGRAFYGCDSLTSITIPNSVISIGDYIFDNCGSLKYNEYDNALYLGNEENPYLVLVKAKDRSITSCEINENTRFINSYAFGIDYGCQNLISITIPSCVTSIGDYAFDCCRDLESVIFEKGSKLTSIGWSAFYECEKLNAVYIADVSSWCSIEFKSQFSNPLYYAHNLYLNNNLVTDLVIPNGVTSIGDYAFRLCDSLTSVTIPKSVTSIGETAFSFCINLKSVNFEIGSQITNIGSSAFSNCVGLESITIPNSVTSIDDDAFSRCDNLTSVIFEAGSSLSSIGKVAFCKCSGLRSITIPKSVLSIGEEAFDGCSGLTIYCEVEEQPSGWASTWNYSNRPIVWNCISNDVASNGYIYMVVDGIKYGIKDDKAKVVVQPKNVKEAIIVESVTYKGKSYPVTSIGDNAFYECTSLTNVIIPNSVTSIGVSAFRKCTSLTSIEIPSSLNSIGAQLFDGCSNLNYNVYDNALYLGNEENPYLLLVQAKDKSITSCEISAEAQIIYMYAFYNCPNLTNVSFGEESRLKRIGPYAFYNCSKLTNIEIPSGVTRIGEEAFYNCSSLTSMTIPSGVTCIYAKTFYGCSGLTSIKFEGESKVKSMGKDAFYKCSGLNSVYIDDISFWCSVEFESTYSNPLYYAHNLYLKGDLVADIIIPSSVTSIGNYAFKYCDSLISVSFEEGSQITSIGNSAFFGCTSLASIEIPSGVTNIGSYAFEDCTSLTSVIIPNSVTSIGASAFRDCISLTIYCEAESKPNGWNSNWNYSKRPVVWGYVSEE